MKYNWTIYFAIAKHSPLKKQLHVRPISIDGSIFVRLNIFIFLVNKISTKLKTALILQN